MPLTWSRLSFYLDVLRRGYTILSVDADISYSKKDVWASFERYAGEVGADMVFMKESLVNAGHFYAVSNERVIAMMEQWIASETVWPGSDDQVALGRLRSQVYVICNTKFQCDKAKQRKMRFVSKSILSKYENDVPTAVAMRLHRSSFARFGSACSPADNSPVDPCASDCLFLHPICVISLGTKMNKLKSLGFWLLDEPCEETISNHFSPRMNVSIFRCVPKALTSPWAEEKFTRCTRSLAWS